MAKILKQQFRNMTGGWTGVVVIGPKGEDTGIPVAPGGTVWLSEEEQVLTANAPRDPRDNPFIPQTLIVTNPETGAREEQPVTPLVAISENRYVPASERPIGLTQSGVEDAGLAQVAATGQDPAVAVAATSDALTRHEEVAALGPDAKPGEPPLPAAADSSPPEAPAETPPAPETPPPAPAAPAEPPAPVSEPASAPSAPAATEEPPPMPTPAIPTPPGADPARTVPADEGRVAPEETAAQTPGPASEETGAAVEPQGEAAAGSYTPGEEVGTPGAPAAPAPWTPGQG